MPFTSTSLTVKATVCRAQFSLAHGTLSHGFISPFFVEFRRGENSGGDTSSIHWGVGVDGPDENFQLGFHTLSLFSILTDHREAPDTLT